MNRIRFVLLSLIAVLSVQSCTQSTYDRYFEDKSLRIDFMSIGDAKTQTAVVHELREEPVWGGPKKNLIEPFGYGEYLMEILDAESGELIYSRSFCSLSESGGLLPRQRQRLRHGTTRCPSLILRTG